MSISHIAVSGYGTDQDKFRHRPNTEMGNYKKYHKYKSGDNFFQLCMEEK